MCKQCLWSSVKYLEISIPKCRAYYCCDRAFVWCLEHMWENICVYDEYVFLYVLDYWNCMLYRVNQYVVTAIFEVLSKK